MVEEKTRETNNQNITDNNTEHSPLVHNGGIVESEEEQKDEHKEGSSHKFMEKKSISRISILNSSKMGELL